MLSDYASLIHAALNVIIGGLMEGLVIACLACKFFGASLAQRVAYESADKF